MPPYPMAFPGQDWSHDDGEYVPYEGMSLRDYFAGQALAQPHDMDAVIQIAQKSRCLPSQALARICFDWAEAMMAERERRYGTGGV